MERNRLKLLSLLLLLLSPQLQAAASLEKCLDTLEKFRSLGDVPEMMAESYGYAVLPTTGKGGFGIEGKAASNSQPLGSSTALSLPGPPVLNHGETCL